MVQTGVKGDFQTYTTILADILSSFDLSTNSNSHLGGHNLRHQDFSCSCSFSHLRPSNQETWHRTEHTLSTE